MQRIRTMVGVLALAGGVAINPGPAYAASVVTGTTCGMAADNSLSTVQPPPTEVFGVVFGGPLTFVDPNREPPTHSWTACSVWLGGP